MRSVPISRLVKRPAFRTTGGRAPIYPYDEILATINTDRALLIATDGRRPEQIISAVGKTVRRRGYRFRHRREKGGVAVWVEKSA